MKILILRFSSIGDIVLTSPVIRCLKTQTNAEIHYATKATFQSLLADNPYIDKLLLLENSLQELVTTLRKEKYDYIIDLHHNLRTFLIKMQLGVPAFSFNKLNFKKWLYVNFKINKLPHIHIVDRYLATCQKLGVVNDGNGLDFFIHQKNEVNIATEFSITSPYLAWVVGAKFATKQLPLQKILELLQHPYFQSYPVILIGGKEDEVFGNTIVAKSTHNIINACGKYNIQQSASILQQANEVWTNDTGMMHIATAFQQKITSFWGNTTPAFGMYAYVSPDKNRNIEVANLSCRPCSKIGFASCPKKHFDCMKKIDSNFLEK